MLIKVGNKGEKTDIQVYCDGIERTQVEFKAVGEKEIRKLFDQLLGFLTEDKNEQ